MAALRESTQFREEQGLCLHRTDPQFTSAAVRRRNRQPGDEWDQDDVREEALYVVICEGSQ